MRKIFLPFFYFSDTLLIGERVNTPFLATYFLGANIFRVMLVRDQFQSCDKIREHVQSCVDAQEHFQSCVDAQEHFQSYVDAQEHFQSYVDA